jgi:uncharacterized membrane protein
MPNLAIYHPQVVHFAIALLFVGVVFRFVSLTGKLRFTNHAAAALLILGTIAAVVSVRSGDDAHGPVERIPGVRDAVIEHEEHGKSAKNYFLVVAALELLALGLAAGTSTARYAKAALIGSAAVGFFGAHQLYEAGEHGGELVYSYAGGPGIRSGDPEDVTRLLVAGLHSQALADRRAGRGADAARLMDELAVRAPGDATAQFLRVESLMLDRKEYPAALAAARAVAVDSANARLATRKASLMADAFLGMGMPDSARAVLTPVVAAFPANTRLKAKLDSIP